MKKIAARKPMPLTLMILLDLILFGIALLVFAYFHHVRPSEESAVGLSSTRTYAKPTAAVTPAPSPTPSPVPTLVLNAATPDEVVLPATEPAHTPDPTIEPVITPTVEPTPDPVGYKQMRIHWVATHVDHQGKGLCRAMLSRLMKRYHELGMTGDVFLFSQTFSYAAISIYQDFGFERYLGDEPVNWHVENFKEAQAQAWQLIDEKIAAYKKKA